MAQASNMDAREQVLELAQRLRHDPDFLAQVEGLLHDGQQTDSVNLSVFTVLFSREDVRHALRSIRNTAERERLDGKDLMAMMPRSDDALQNGVAAAIVAAAAATAAAALV